MRIKLVYITKNSIFYDFMSYFRTTKLYKIPYNLRWKFNKILDN